MVGAFEKIKCILSIASVGNLEKSRECTGRTTWRHRMLAFSIRCTIGSDQMKQSALAHRSESGAQRPVCGRFTTLSAHGSAKHR